MKEIKHKEVYFESSQWIRLANTIIWAVGAIFIPISFSAYAYALSNNSIYIPLALGSLLIWIIWLYIIYIYGYTAGKCRIALAKIEAENDLGYDFSIYTEQNKIFYGPFGFKYGFIVITILFIIPWCLGYFFTERVNPNIEPSTIGMPANNNWYHMKLNNKSENVIFSDGTEMNISFLLHCRLSNDNIDKKQLP